MPGRVPGIHAFETWMAGSCPAMTANRIAARRRGKTRMVSAEFAIRSPPLPSMVRKRTTNDSAVVEIDPRFARVVAVFARNRRVSRGGGRGFGSGALKVNGKIFAMMDSKGRFVVKLPGARVDALVAAGQGAYFDPGHGRKMKEWAVIAAAPAVWPTFAREACAFVQQE